MIIMIRRLSVGDRFAVKTSMGYPDAEGELGLLERRDNRRTLAPSVDPAVTTDTVLELQDLAEDIHVDEKIRRYIIDLARATREDRRTEIGVSPRGIQRIFEAVRASAVIGGREYATPEDVKRMARATMSHRLILTTEATVEGVEPDDIVGDVLDSVDVPAVAPDEDEADDDAAEDGQRDGTVGESVRPVFESQEATDGAPAGAETNGESVE